MEDIAVRVDGSVIDGISDSEWKECKELYKELSEEEMIHIIDSYGSGFCSDNFHLRARSLNSRKIHEKKYGKVASFTTSLFMLLSVHVTPRDSSSSLSVFGEITSGSGSGSGSHPNECYLYKRESKDAENISGPDGGYLTLNGPSDSCRPDEVSFLLQSRTLSIRLYSYDGPGQHLLIDKDDILLDYSEGCFEHVQDKVVEDTQISLTLKYVSIPMALHGWLGIRIFNRAGYESSSTFLDVHGKVVAKYKNKFGNCESEEVVLFDKNRNLNHHERVLLEMFSNSLSLQRCWVAAPAYSLLGLRIDLFDSGEKPIFTGDVELEIKNWK